MTPTCERKKKERGEEDGWEGVGHLLEETVSGESGLAGGVWTAGRYEKYKGTKDIIRNIGRTNRLPGN